MEISDQEKREFKDDMRKSLEEELKDTYYYSEGVPCPYGRWYYYGTQKEMKVITTGTYMCEICEHFRGWVSDEDIECKNQGGE